MGPAQEQAVRLPDGRRTGRPVRKGVQGPVPGSFQRHHPVARRRHSRGREGGVRRVRPQDVPRTRQELRGQTADDAGARRRDGARGLLDVRRGRRRGVPGRGAEASGGHPLRQHGRLRRRARDGGHQGKVRGRHRSAGEDIRDRRGPHTREGVPHSGLALPRAVREGPQDDRRQEGATWAGRHTR